MRANGNCSWRCLNGRETLRSCVRSFPRPPWVLGRRPSLTATSRRAALWRPPATRATSANQNRLSSPYLTLHWSWMLNDFAFGQLASTCRSSGNFMSPYFSISLATLYRPAPTAELAFDREGRHAKVRQGVGVLSHQDSCRSGGELGRTLRRDFLRLRRRNHLGLGGTTTSGPGCGKSGALSGCGSSIGVGGWTTSGSGTGIGWLGCIGLFLWAGRSGG